MRGRALGRESVRSIPLPLFCHSVVPRLFCRRCRREDIMKAMEFQVLVDQLGGLAKEQREALIEAVEVRASANRRCCADRLPLCRRCPRCQSIDVGTWFEAKAADALHVPCVRQNVHCPDRHAAGALGDRRDAWLTYGQSLADGISPRKAAKRCGILAKQSRRPDRSKYSAYAAIRIAGRVPVAAYHQAAQEPPSPMPDVRLHYP